MDVIILKSNLFRFVSLAMLADLIYRGVARCLCRTEDRKAFVCHRDVLLYSCWCLIMVVVPVLDYCYMSCSDCPFVCVCGCYVLSFKVAPMF